MQLYFSLAHRAGTDEALALAKELSSWHDEMVVHARAVARRGRVACDDACPHVRAIALWQAARDVLGDHQAARFVFLRQAAARP